MINYTFTQSQHNNGEWERFNIIIDKAFLVNTYEIEKKKCENVNLALNLEIHLQDRG